VCNFPRLASVSERRPLRASREAWRAFGAAAQSLMLAVLVWWQPCDENSLLHVVLHVCFFDPCYWLVAICNPAASASGRMRKVQCCSNGKFFFMATLQQACACANLPTACLQQSPSKPAPVASPPHRTLPGPAVRAGRRKSFVQSIFQARMPPLTAARQMWTLQQLALTGY
jgi:hypothetical protein